jgi:nitrate/TMAO reductase-like tetraheme cytochrome c subunit
MLSPPKRSVYARHKSLFILGGIVVEVVLLAALVILAVVVFGSIYYRVTEHPKFCGYVCHNMNASYESYKSSAHNDLHCAKCHSKPGFAGALKAATVDAGREIYIYMLGEDAYDMDELHPEIHNESCMQHGCHKAEKLTEKKSLFMDRNIFSHGAHISVASAHGHSGGPATAEESSSSLTPNCINCHSQSKDKHMAVDARVCFLCHFGTGSDESGLQECVSCHVIPAADHDEYMAEEGTVCSDCHEMATGETSVPPEKCDECHEVEKRSLNSEEAHKLHVEPQNARCMECHESIEHEF